MKVIVTIPAYNEARTIGPVIKNIKRIMDKTNYKYEVLVVNDGSRDSTAKVAEEAGAKVYSHRYNRGLAEAFRTEMENCIKMKADIIVHTDADGQYLAEEIPKLIRKVEEGYDLVLGSRFAGKIESMPWIKKLGNRAFSSVLSSITGIRISDGQTGFRAFTRETAENIKITSDYTYTQEQIIRAVRNNLRIAQTPIYFAKRGGKTKSRLMKGPLDYAIKAWTNILRLQRDYNPLKFFGKTGLAFFSIGFLIGLWLIYLVITTGEIGHYPSAILSALLMITGIQIFMVGLLADMKK